MARWADAKIIFDHLRSLLKPDVSRRGGRMVIRVIRVISGSKTTEGGWGYTSFFCLLILLMLLRDGRGRLLTTDLFLTSDFTDFTDFCYAALGGRDGVGRVTLIFWVWGFWLFPSLGLGLLRCSSGI